MDSISIRYGETVTLPLDSGDTHYVSADIYVGKPGYVYVITQHITLTDGKGTFVIPSDDTKIPLDTYFYQINVTGPNGAIQKFPSPEDACDSCDSDFPKFIVSEALDQTEVS